MEFAVLDPSGTVLSVEHSEQAAASVATSYGFRDVAFDHSLEVHDELTANVALGPDIAWEECQRLEIPGQAVNAMSLETAHQLLQPYFPLRKGKPVTAYQTPQGMIEYILGQNEKTAKSDPRAYINVKGLSLLPHRTWSQMIGKDFGFHVNTCVGSSPECREACLVYSGRNETDIYNVLVKQARMSALFGEPIAFGRILKAACERHARGGHKAGFLALLRLNVFSDLPWEMIYPDLFREVAVRFYDYTKVPNRRFDNYDLTFSYSGRNARHARSEIERGRRVAVVFLTKKYDLKTGVSYMPRTLRIFGGKYDVIDGDVSDARVLDPDGVIVGLAYKLPKARSGQRKRSAKGTAFVVPVEEVDGQLVAAVVPREQPGVAEADTADDTLPAADEVIGEEHLRRLPLVG